VQLSTVENSITLPTRVAIVDIRQATGLLCEAYNKSPNSNMAKSHLIPRGPQGFEKFSPSSSSDKAYIRLKSKAHNKPFVHTPFHISTKHIPNKLVIRTKSSKMPNTSSPKRVRRGSDAEERPTKHSRRLSDSGMTYGSPHTALEPCLIYYSQMCLHLRPVRAPKVRCSSCVCCGSCFPTLFFGILC
jgi:hypothetical protein